MAIDARLRHQSTMQRRFGDIRAICGNKIAWPMKMGNIVSPWHSDAAA
jgi:hypothetical protein